MKKILNGKVKIIYDFISKEIMTLKDILPNGIAKEIVAILVFAIIIGFYNRIMACFTIISYLYGMMLSITREGKIKIAINLILIILAITTLYNVFNYSAQGERFLNIMLKKNTWIVWLSCITVNSFIFSKLCKDKKFIERVSYSVSYILVLVMGVYFSITIDMIYMVSQQDDRSTIVNFICFVFMIIYNILDAILPTKEEIVLYLCWKYELDYKNGIIRFIHYKGKKRNVNVNDIYTIRGRVFHSYVCEGAFLDSDKI